MKRDFTFSVGMVLGLLVLLPLLYLLAGGPVVFMCSRGWISAKTSNVLCAPINWAEERGLYSATGLKRPMSVYYSWCYSMGEPAKPNPQGRANGRQPFRLETNSASPTAASRRSP